MRFGNNDRVYSRVLRPSCETNDYVKLYLYDNAGNRKNSASVNPITNEDGELEVEIYAMKPGIGVGKELLSLKDLKNMLITRVVPNNMELATAPPNEMTQYEFDIQTPLW